MPGDLGQAGGSVADDDQFLADHPAPHLGALMPGRVE
jgi:hypothetical protein